MLQGSVFRFHDAYHSRELSCLGKRLARVRLDRRDFCLMRSIVFETVFETCFAEKFGIIDPETMETSTLRPQPLQ